MRLFLFICFAVLSLSACKHQPENQSSVQEDTFIKQGELTIINAKGDSIIFDTELADTPEKSEKGLMYRKHMKENQGMFFIFEYEKPLSFWMKNTYIPLDIIFIDADYQVVSISENCMPLNEEMIPSLAPAQYVLEINAGLSRKYQIKSGQTVVFNK